MTTLQIPLSPEMQKMLKKRTHPVGVSSTAYVKILIARDLGLLPENDFEPGNLFHANRDNDGQGISFSKMKNMLSFPEKS